ncbi:hypothetical protein V7794_07910 [Rhizobium laguerreae]
MHEIITRVDEVRRLKGFLTIAQTLQLADLGVTVIDPFSTLISSRASLGSDVFLWPNVTIEVGPEGSVSIGASTVLHSGVRIEAGAGSIAIGANGDLGREGGFTLLVGAQSDKIDVGNDVRLSGSGSITQSATIGNGAQVLGPIRIQNCQLGGGGSFRERDPDKRGAVMKGSGVARNIDLPAGMVIQAFGLFSEAPKRWQSYFHPQKDEQS